MSDKLWHLGYYKGVHHDEWSAYIDQGPPHGRGLKDPCFVLTGMIPLRRPPRITKEDLKRYGVPDNTVWAIVQIEMKESEGVQHVLPSHR